MTQLEYARAGEITPEMVQAAAYDGVSPEEIRKKVAEGTVVIPRTGSTPSAPGPSGRG